MTPAHIKASCEQGLLPESLPILIRVDEAVNHPPIVGRVLIHDIHPRRVGAEAEAEAARAIELLEAAVRDNPHDAILLEGLWHAYWKASSTYEEQNNRLSYEFSLKAMRIIEEIVKRDPADIRAKQLLSKTFSMLGQTSINTGRPQEALIYLEKASAVLREITESRTKNRGLRTDLTTILMRLGEAKYKQGKFQQALADFQQAADIHLETLRNLPDDSRTKRNLALTYESIAETHEKLGARDSAKNHYLKTLGLLLELEANNILSEYDRKFLVNRKMNLQRFEKIGGN
jgi:tetratricopeptide (TPR) repeat protein